ncbi:MAG: histidinol-phosphate transaminase [Ornithinimicrobium sp.]
MTASPDFPVHLIRADLRAFAGYSSARTSHAGPAARIWLNANEAAEPNRADTHGTARRYPSPQPQALRQAFADYLGVDAAGLLLARGSDEAIDTLVRTVCGPGGEEGVVLCPPTFGMYAVSATVHGVPVHEVSQVDTGHRFDHDLGRVSETVRRTGARVVFLASPGNPTGSTVPREDLDQLLGDLAGRAVVVLDEAYAEFARPAPTSPGAPAAGSGAVPSAADLSRHPHLAVLRTMSKAHGLAGARVGALVAHPELVDVLRRVQAPYPLATPAVDLALAALTHQALRDTAARVQSTKRRRDRLADVLSRHPDVSTVYDSEANFVLVRCSGPDAVLNRLREAGIAVRDMRHLPGLADALRVSVGTGEEIEFLAEALSPVSGARGRTLTDHPSPPALTEESPP